MSDGMIPPAISLPWRAGGPGARIVYAQAAEAPSDSDQILATFTDGGVALAAVRAHNAALAGL
jgi:hypothetical protein